jgi:hypothetical protein
MTVTESKLRKGLLILGGLAAPPGVDFACQPTAVSVTSEFNEDGEKVETLCGDELLPTTTAAATLKFTAIQDFEDIDGLVRYSWAHNLEVVDFRWTPDPTKIPSLTGTVQVRRLDIGGDVNKRLTSDAEWPVQDGPVFDDTPPPPPTATAGTPGTFAPPSAMPANLAALQASSIVASPATAWTTGQHVLLGDASHASWNGTAWVAGDAALLADDTAAAGQGVRR